MPRLPLAFDFRSQMPLACASMLGAGLIASSLFAAGDAPASTSGSSCPVATLYCAGERIVTAPRDSVYCLDHVDYPIEVGFDLVLGIAYSRGAYGWVRATDEYVVEGVPAGAELRFAARIEARVQACRGFDDGGSGRCVVRDGANEVRLFHGGGPEHPCSEVQGVLRLELQKIAGVPFRLEYEARSDRGSTGGSGAAHLRVTFVDLPAGARIRSCHGYQQEMPTPASPVTWGRVKARYQP